MARCNADIAKAKKIGVCMVEIEEVKYKEKR